MLSKHRITNLKYECIVTRIQGGDLSLDFDPDPSFRRGKQNSKTNSLEEQGVTPVSDGLRKLHVSAINLQKVKYFHK